MVIPCLNLREFFYLRLFLPALHTTDLCARLHLRQRLIEQAFEVALLEQNVPVHFQRKLESYTVHEVELDPFPVHCVIRDLKTNSTYEIHGCVSPNNWQS